MKHSTTSSWINIKLHIKYQLTLASVTLYITSGFQLKTNKQTSHADVAEPNLGPLTEHSKANLLTSGCGEESAAFIVRSLTRRMGGLCSKAPKSPKGFSKAFLKAG